MGYLGQQPTIGAYHVLDSITLSNGQSAYTMQLDGVNFSPQSVNHMLVIINGVPQPASAYSINGHILTLSSAATTGDVLNEIRVFGDVLNIGTPSDATLTNAKTNFESTSSAAGLQIKGDGTTDGTLQLNCSQNSHGVKIASPNHAAGQSYTLTLPSTAPSANKALITDGSGNLSFGSAGGLAKLLVSTSSSGVANFDIDSTYINSTYDNYKIIAGYTQATDNQRARIRFFVGGTVKETDYSYENGAGTSSTYEYDADGATYMQVGGAGGNATGETSTLLFDLTNVNSTTIATRIHGYHYGSATNGATVGRFFQAGQDVSNIADVVNGLRIYIAAGNIVMRHFAIYGLVK